MGEKGFNKRFVKCFSMGVTKSTGEAEYKKCIVLNYVLASGQCERRVEMCPPPPYLGSL